MSQIGGLGDLLDVRACVGYVVLMSGLSQYLQSLKNSTHNLKAVGSNPTPATNKNPENLMNLSGLASSLRGVFSHFGVS